MTTVTENRPSTASVSCLSNENFAFITKYLLDKAGMVFGESKKYLFESRLNPIASRNDLDNIDALITKVRTSMDQNILTEIIEAMATYETLFFRDKKPFDYLENHIMPELLETRANSKSIRIWSSASSSGQETYSIGMIVDDFSARLTGWQKEILASDISTQILNKAKAGEYSQFEVQRGLPVPYLVKHFKQNGTKWVVNDGLKSMINFKQHNLINDPSKFGKFDVVFCRNVLFYFDAETKKKIFSYFADALNPGGYMIIGSSETTLGLSDRFAPVEGFSGVYKLA